MQQELFKATETDILNLFIPLVKVDEEKRLVFGRVTEETPDSANEVFDYATSKPHYEEWIGYFQKATDGKSSGNLRAMHDAKKAVGTLPQVSLLDKEKAVEVVAKVSDNEEWAKVLDGVYTGFSQGGKYIKKWYDGKSYRYTAKPTEISLVDYPALKSATFSLIKSDGIIEERTFKKPVDPPKPDLKKYAGEEISDVHTALTALETIFYVYEKETSEEEKNQSAALKAVVDNLKRFIASEIMEEGEVIEMNEKIGELKKLLEGLAGDLEKKLNKEGLAKVQAIHDHSVGMGAKCYKEAAEPIGDLQKLEAEKADALKKIGEMTAEIEALKTKVAELEKKPEPPKGAKMDVGPITKADDSKATIGKLEDPKEPIDALKKAHSEPKLMKIYGATTS